MTLPASSEKAFEDAICGHLLASGYDQRPPSDYDRALGFLPEPLLDFLHATQPGVWRKYQKIHGDEARANLLRRVHGEIEKHGTLHVLHHGVTSAGCTFRLAAFPPNSGLNPATAKLHEANQHSFVRQLRYSTHDKAKDRSLDLVLFLNGLPLFTAELKNPFSGQTAAHAIAQYRRDRAPKGEPLFAFARCLGHFAVDANEVYVSTRLDGDKSRFLPFNQGNAGGAGNPVAWKGYATSYLWEDVWSPASVVELVQHFLHVVDSDHGKGARRLDFPRYHQRAAVRQLVASAREHGAGQRALVQHSAGSGKSNTIAWLAHRLAILHGADDERVFHSVIVITDRRVLDRQLRRTVHAFARQKGVVTAIDQGSTQLAEALQKGGDIITTTLQKFPHVLHKIGELPGSRYAVIIDEAHSSQGGEGSASLKAVLDTGDLDAAEAAEAEEEDDNPFEKLVELPEEGDEAARAAQRRRRWPPNVSVFAFTATPKPRTLELFGTKQADGRFLPVSLYSMRQAIEEGFILDVLASYTTYKAFWHLTKTISADPSFEKKKAAAELRAFAERQDEAIDQKVKVILDHFTDKVAGDLGGRAKAMIVTRSRAHAVLFKRAVDRAIAERKIPFGALVAFSGTVRHDGVEYTEADMNGFPESQTAGTFDQDRHRLLIVANKFQTGFDQPLLAAMYVDKKLGGVAAVQTLSRLNRTIPGVKERTFVLDFANRAEEIEAAFQPYYEATWLSKSTDRDLLHDLEGRIYGTDLVTDDEVRAFGDLALRLPGAEHQDERYRFLHPIVERFKASEDAEKKLELRTALNEYARLYSFLSQILSFSAPDLERLHLFARHLLRVLPAAERRGLPPELLHAVGLHVYELHDKGTTKIQLERGPGTLDPQEPKPPPSPIVDEYAELSRILQTLNERFGTDFKEEDKVFVEALEDRLDQSPALAGSLKVNPTDTVKLTFDNLVEATLERMMDANFTFYQRVADDDAFGKYFLSVLFERFLRRQGGER